MDQAKTWDWIIEYGKKYRFVVLILLIGIMFLALPERKSEEASAHPDPVQETPSPQTSESLEASLEELLSHMEGAGKVRVLLTQASGEAVYYQQDENSQQTDNSSDIRRQTVIISDPQREESGLIHKIDPPIYRGAIILCQGADRAFVRLSIVEAVSNATGLTSDRITVLKMK